MPGYATGYTVCTKPNGGGSCTYNPMTVEEGWRCIRFTTADGNANPPSSMQVYGGLKCWRYHKTCDERSTTPFGDTGKSLDATLFTDFSKVTPSDTPLKSVWCKRA